MTKDWAPDFLTALAAGHTVSAAARAARVGSGAVYSRRRDDADFAEAMRLAHEDAADTLEAEAIRRGRDGIDKLVIHQGQPTPVYERTAAGDVLLAPVTRTVIDKKGDPREVTTDEPVQARNPDGSLKWLTVKEYSDALLLATLKAKRAEYRVERKEVTGADGSPLVPAEPDEDRIKQLLAIARARAARAAAEADDEPLA